MERKLLNAEKQNYGMHSTINTDETKRLLSISASNEII